MDTKVGRMRNTEHRFNSRRCVSVNDRVRFFFSKISIDGCSNKHDRVRHVWRDGGSIDYLVR